MVVALWYTKKALSAVVEVNNDARWIIKHLRRISRTRAAYILGRQPNAKFFYICTFFDPEEGICTNYNDRPRMCREFPWYGRVPDREVIANYPNCSYLEDLA